ncbi:uncharacterized protein BO97DRAFT_417149 [Aspergillus homomorphus CBS 101889]|uniref:Uncharacterized protein n=1 Tax=Aspergillus homomorphus (strain CBS 101889) TaxID=1450537 RepID=A0A395HN76_ASPHC|nr:hypothetical protein BO97DRAFT_417149 [Aspergillus homomorphus CBS 101889]RAL09076.1 hypothetical protein BO97DRAFT_417149 [Aspergillus homomorphus CBS 101889]
MSRASILDLPSEILSQILHQILFDTFDQQVFRAHNANTTALLLICRQFYHLILPIHYRELEFSHSTRQKASCLLRSLLSNPRLLWLVRSLKIVLQSCWTPDPLAVEDYTAAAEVLHLFRGVQVHTLQICGEVVFSPEDQERLRVLFVPEQKISTARWELLHHAIRHLPALRRVVLTRWRDEPGYGFGGRFDCQLQGYEELRALPGTYPTILSAIWRETRECCASSQDNVVLGQPSTNHMIDLSIAFDDLIEIGTPDTATKFKEFYTWLQSRPHALRRMVLGDIKFQELGLGDFRATAFPNLHTVVCPTFYVSSATEPGHYWPAAVVLDQLLGPTVQTFVWDLTSYAQQHGEGLWEFDEEQARLLLALAESAAADEDTALQTIQIRFNPETDRTDSMGGEDYPWDRIERLQQEIRALGMDLEYSTPTLTREEYRQLREEERRWEESAEHKQMLANMLSRVGRSGGPPDPQE